LFFILNLVDLNLLPVNSLADTPLFGIYVAYILSTTIREYVKRQNMKDGEESKVRESRPTGLQQPSSGQQISTSPQRRSSLIAGAKICVIGGGFVGIVTAAGFAEFEHQVECVEINERALNLLKTGKIPFYEQELESLVVKHLQSGRLTFTGNLAEHIETQDAVFVTVGTPPSETGRAELTALNAVVDVLSAKMRSEQIVVLKSTVPVGTGQYVKERMLSHNGSHGIPAVVNNPEFLREGTAVYDFFHPQRIVIGGDNPQAIQRITDIYRLGMVHNVPIVVTNNETAELIKYASNAFLATKIGFINELACLCDRLGVNVLEIARGMGMDQRISSQFLDPGPGWGGSCLGKDMKELTGLARSQDVNLLIGEAVLKSNERQFEFIVGKVKTLVGDLAGKRIGVLGLSFKANTSDMRDSPAIPIIEQLVGSGAEVVAFDPQAGPEAAKYLPELCLMSTPGEVAIGSDCLLILTEWREFQLLDFKALGSAMRQKNVVDARNLLVPESVQRLGFKYAGVGVA
jgi:UDPglucose 6-dehydrogenase